MILKIMHTQNKSKGAYGRYLFRITTNPFLAFDLSKTPLKRPLDHQTLLDDFNAGLAILPSVFSYILAFLTFH